MNLQRPLTARTIRFGALFAVFSICLLLLSGLSQAGDKRPTTVQGHLPRTCRLPMADATESGLCPCARKGDAPRKVRRAARS